MEKSKDGMNQNRSSYKHGELEYTKETFLVHGKPWDEYWEYGHHAIPPITASTTFRLETTKRGYEGFLQFNKPLPEGTTPIYIYDRLGEPTVALLENSFRVLEGGESATAFASGMASISTTLLVLCKAGDHILAHKTIYGCTYSLLTEWIPKFGIETSFIDMTNLEELKSSIKENTRVIYFETPANPTLELIDIKAVSELAKEVNKGRKEEERLWVVVDNTFATPYCQRPRELGADIVVQSLTKDVSGFGTDMGGMVVGPISIHERIRLARKDFGGVLSPRSAWSILVYGLSSLHVRVRQQMKNAMAVAEYLSKNPHVAKLSYPGHPSHPQYELAKRQMVSFSGEFAPGIMVYFELKGEGKELLEKASKFMDYIAKHSYCITLAVSLGHIKTLIEAPLLMTHTAYGDPEEASKSGLSVGGIRLSMGIEEPEDIIKDLNAAFKQLD